MSTELLPPNPSGVVWGFAGSTIHSLPFTTNLYCHVPSEIAALA